MIDSLADHGALVSLRSATTQQQKQPVKANMNSMDVRYARDHRRPSATVLLDSKIVHRTLVLHQDVKRKGLVWQQS